MTARKTGCASPAETDGRKSRRSDATLTITNGCFAGLKMPITHACTSLGSSLECDICLDGSRVSGEHAVIRKSKGEYVIEDMNSRHGTAVNGTPTRRNTLHSGDVIEIGKFRMVFSC